MFLLGIGTGAFFMLNGALVVGGLIANRYANKKSYSVIKFRDFGQIPASEIDKLDSSLKSSHLRVIASPRTKTLVRNSTASVAVAAIGFLFQQSFLGFISGVITALNFVFTYKNSFASYSKNRRLELGIVFSASTLVLLLSGRYLASALTWNFFAGIKRLETSAKSSSRVFLANFFAKEENEIWLITEGVEIAVRLQDLQVNDVISLRTGSIVPVDGVVIKGSAKINPFFLAPGLSRIEKKVGDEIYACSKVESGSLVIQCINVD